MIKSYIYSISIKIGNNLLLINMTVLKLISKVNLKINGKNLIKYK